MKYLLLAALALVAWRLISGRWPWQASGPAGNGRNQAAARTLLGVGPGASRQDIIEAHRRLVAMVHPDRGGTADQVHEANAARDLLLARLPQARD